MQSITSFIERKLGLIVNATKSKIGKPREIKFLGFGYYKFPDGKYYAIPHKLSIEKLHRKLKILTRRNWSIPLDIRFKLLKQQITGWVYYFRIAKMKTAAEHIDERIRKRIRVVIWKQWKTIHKRYVSLRQLGATHSDAYKVANCRKGYQYVCTKRIIHSCLNNERLAKRGLISVLTLYEKVHLVAPATS